MTAGLGRMFLEILQPPPLESFSSKVVPLAKLLGGEIIAQKLADAAKPACFGASRALGGSVHRGNPSYFGQKNGVYT